MATFFVPEPEGADAADVRAQLDGARASWEQGDTPGTLRALGAAAEAAERAGDDHRALALARALAELRDGIAHEAPPPPKPTTGKPPPPPSMRASPSMPPPPSARARADAMPPQRQAPANGSTNGAHAEKPAAHAEKPAAHAEKPAAHAEKPVTQAAPRAAAVPSVAPAPAKAAERPAPSGERLRVSVKPSVRDPSLLVVRVLGPGEPVPKGAHEAFLTPSQEGVDLLGIQN